MFEMFSNNVNCQANFCKIINKQGSASKDDTQSKIYTGVHRVHVYVLSTPYSAYSGIPEYGVLRYTILLLYSEFAIVKLIFNIFEYQNSIYSFEMSHMPFI
jgi:hypothetical protein